MIQQHEQMYYSNVILDMYQVSVDTSEKMKAQLVRWKDIADDAREAAGIVVELLPSLLSRAACHVNPHMDTVFQQYLSFEGFYGTSLLLSNCLHHTIPKYALGRLEKDDCHRVGSCCAASC